MLTCDCGWKPKPGGYILADGKGSYECPDCKKTLIECKPPIGVMPEKMWLEMRIRELARAIGDYIEAGLWSTKDEKISLWCRELQRHMEQWNYLNT